MWAYESVFYQIYPLGFCGAPLKNDGVAEPRILKVIDWADHIRDLNCNAVYFSPIFESDAHGYDTRDYTKVDCRLGSNEDFVRVCKELHDREIKVVLDGVFNHVGRGFWAFKDLQENRENSRYKDWFHVDFGGNSEFNDGFWYEGWEGHYELVKLNLRNEEVIEHIFTCIKGWVDEFDIDGLRLDVAYCLDRDFLKRLRAFANDIKEEFVLIGELLHGDYSMFVSDEMLHSATNYQCYKGLYSSFNSMNMFEICHSLKNQFGPEQWCQYRGMHLLNFVDNHDVSRIATILNDKHHVPLAYAILFGMPGIPCIYYGSEWGTEADKADGDAALRVSFDAPEENELSELITKLAKIHRDSKALCYGDISVPVLTNKQCIIQRSFEDERILIAVNAEDQAFTAQFDAGCETMVDLLTGSKIDFSGGCELTPYSAQVWKPES